MASAELWVLDVGHGNCAVLRGPRDAVVFDAGIGSTLLEFLEEQHIERIDSIIISHADMDHIGGLLAILSQNVVVETVYMNPDATKKTDIWKDLRVIVADMKARGIPTRILTSLTTDTGIPLRQPELNIEVLSPAPAIAMSGTGGTDLKGRTLTSNSMSAVVRINLKKDHAIMLAGDIDGVGLESLLEGRNSLKTRILVFPHHGGFPANADPEGFSKRLCETVDPEVVIFSIGRGKHGTPRPEIVAAVKSVCPGTHIACTQLSMNCATQLPSRTPDHLSNAYAQGRHKGECCTGTIRLVFTETGLEYQPPLKAHFAFVVACAPTALCLRPVNQIVNVLVPR